jgi:hypothetical protein
MKYLFILLLLIPMYAFSQETVVITDENGETKTCKVIESGAIICL